MAYNKKAPEGAKQGKLTEEAKTSSKKADDWTLIGWLKLSKSGKMVKVSQGEGENTIFIGLVSLRQLERMLAGEISGVPIKTPPETQEE